MLGSGRMGQRHNQFSFVCKHDLVGVGWGDVLFLSHMTTRSCELLGQGNHVKTYYIDLPGPNHIRSVLFAQRHAPLTQRIECLIFSRVRWSHNVLLWVRMAFWTFLTSEILSIPLQLQDKLENVEDTQFQWNHVFNYFFHYSVHWWHSSVI